MGGLFLRLRTWWETADRTQKTVTLFGGAFLAILLLGTFYFASKPKLQTAFTGLSMQDMGRVTEEIANMGIPYEMDPSGGVSIPADKVAEVKAKLAVAGKLPATGGTGGGLGESSPFEPRDLQQERQRVRLENEIAESIRYIEGIESARVKIAPANNSLFVEDKRPATAAVTIMEKGGTGMGREQIQAIANLVAYSTPSLDTNHVTVTNQRGEMLWEGMGQDTASGVAQKKLSAEIQEAGRRERELQAFLDQAFGPGSIIVNVGLSLDFNSKETRESTPTISENAARKESAVETMAGDSAGSSMGSGGAGISTNTAAGSNTFSSGGGGSKNYTSEQKSEQFLEGRREVLENKAAGSITTMNISVLADSDKLQDQEAAIQEIVDSFLPPQAATEPDSYNSTVKMVKFDTTSTEAAKKAAAAGAMGDKIQQVVSILPIVALLLVGFMVVKAISKAAKDQTVLVQALPDGRMMPISVPMSLGGSTAATPAEVAAQVAAAGGDPSALPALKKAKQEIGEIPDNVNVPLEQIKKMSVERPEAVAMLIKSWLLEDRR